MYYAIKEQHSAPMQQGLVSLAKEQLQESIENFDTVMIEEIDKLKEIKNSDQIDYMLSDF